ncbi:glucose 1-dehydrogenase [Burkholderia metallica]|uniref:glucose 1-dehydrogenase n=1 Tax=Burkholderia metallica TaxID=488729 RepID=UPI001CF200D4|nr:glucose 1-dehydrogenase [Burkholderia metallica]MCA8017653.1 glucose 1-dehydrogenase [Burkholderia metallica]
MGRLEGKVAIVTGGARGMGAATCRLFAAEGARVVIGDVLDEPGEALARELGDAARFMRLDVADEANWIRVTEATIEQFGRIDVLVNNAAVLTFGGITELSKRDFERAVSINLVGTFVGIRTIAPHMIARKSGSIVNISSVDGLRGVNALAAYVSSKWGVRGLTKVAALELGHQGVRVNSIHPGGVNTAMSNPTGAPLEEINKHYANVPLQRVGLPDEIARATLFLASDEASYCNGAELAVDGGMAAGAYYPGLPGAPF